MRHTSYFVKRKGTADNITIDVDKASERKILDILKSKFPKHNFLSEEAGKEDNNSDYCWVIDPIDGTGSYFSGMPTYGVSIGLLRNGEPHGVSIEIHDLSGLSDRETEESIKTTRWDLKENKTFVLLPDSYPIVPSVLDRKAIVKKGKVVLGSVHNHPSANPPSSGDFSSVLHLPEEIYKGVIADGDLYFLVRSQDTPRPELEPTGDIDTLHDYENKMVQEIERRIKAGENEREVRFEVLKEHCVKENIALYLGNIAENKYKRVV